jgi:DNA-directed RNA polymerase subunit RPC12/RpoP
MRLDDYECATCGMVVRDVDSTDEQAVRWVYCPRCDKEREMVKRPGGHFGNANEVKEARERK